MSANVEDITPAQARHGTKGLGAAAGDLGRRRCWPGPDLAGHGPPKSLDAWQAGTAARVRLTPCPWHAPPRRRLRPRHGPLSRSAPSPVGVHPATRPAPACARLGRYGKRALCIRWQKPSSACRARLARSATPRPFQGGGRCWAIDIRMPRPCLPPPGQPVRRPAGKGPGPRLLLRLARVRVYVCRTRQSYEYSIAAGGRGEGGVGEGRAPGPARVRRRPPFSSAAGRLAARRTRAPRHRGARRGSRPPVAGPGVGGLLDDKKDGIALFRRLHAAKPHPKPTSLTRLLLPPPLPFFLASPVPRWRRDES